MIFPAGRLRRFLLPLFCAALIPFPAKLQQTPARALPLRLPAYVPDHASLARTAKDAAIEAAPGGFALVFPEPYAEPIPAVDTRYGWRFSRAVYVYAPPRPGSPPGLFQRAVIHHEPEQRLQALRTARLLTRLLRLHRQRFSRDATFPRDADAMHVYLAPERPTANAHMGGETRDNQLYVFAAASRERTPLEWVRTLAHEWGHATLPAARSYTEPENDAAGYLGERLYLKWLREDKNPGSGEDGVRSEDLDIYHRRQVAPLIARFHEGGPYSRLLSSGTFTENMDYYVGMALAFDDAFGSTLLGRALFTIGGVKPGDLTKAMAEAVTEQPQVTVRLPAWVPLTKTRYTLTAEKSGSVAFADRSPLALRPDRKASLSVLVPGWKWTRAVSDGVNPITLRRQDVGRRL